MPKHFIAVITLIVLASCSEYQKILKSSDYDLKYNKAKEYYNAKQYTKATTLLDELVPLFKGTERSEEALFLIANAYFGQKDYVLSEQYFTQIAKQFPSSKYLEDCYYMRAYSLYKSSPNVNLDQSDTQKAIEAFELYLNLYPNTTRDSEVQGYIQELIDKLAYKQYLAAKLYYDLGDYLGNNYLSAVITAQNCLRTYPETKYREQLSYLILDSKYLQAVNSVQTKKAERYRATIDEYYSFINEFPNSSFKKDAEKIFKSSESNVKNK